MKKPFYGFGNYLADEGKKLGGKMIFVLAEDMGAARAILVQELYLEGEPVPNSCMVCAGNEIQSRWLLAAVMQSKEAVWSSGVPTPTVQTIAKRKRKEYLS